MPIPFTCPTCHRSGQAADRMAGQTAQCPACKSPLILNGLYPPPPPEPPAAEILEEEYSAASNWGSASAVLRVILWAVCLAGIAFMYLTFSALHQQVNGAVQEASLGAVFCFWLMAGFFAVYAIDRLLSGGRR